ncbi:MAG: hypothetical protein QXG39_04675 [Candidatus Aenigmatarchaeota archaeon]
MQEKKVRSKGVIVANFLYLVIFYVLYFLMIPVIQYTVEMISGIDIFSSYPIPDSTKMFMNLILYVVVPLLALIWTIWSSQPQYQYQ